ncbi:hypothetical protein LS74_008930 [Helicobacter magdeburgensis]|uniref:Uncharacterized protein n=3 Tax=Helicobacter TaxID=209 RepID=A0A4U8SX42_9HELI|nr:MULTISPECIES: hypothetical protein [Helicobacter]EMZ38463.1 hypothetical protein C826_01499 [Helicobacter bilis WiWa]TLD91358.1 hypothetical protein LS74_008930 [Helicobacter magdeburgensis]TLE04754.1 hypothetical protein LS77_005060 [Helicobacter bilis]TLE06023.1 hypothetical protein LS76_004030 [Helicobacter bilis]
MKFVRIYRKSSKDDINLENVTSVSYNDDKLEIRIYYIGGGYERYKLESEDKHNEMSATISEAIYKERE